MQETSKYTHILQGDLSGIQDFIFNVRSEGAAKTLKGRSYFVQAVSELCEHWLTEEMNGPCERFYNGGGNFYLFCRDVSPHDLQTWREKIQSELSKFDIYLNLSIAPYSEAFGSMWTDIHQTANRDKLRKYQEYPEALEPHAYKKRYDGPDAWKLFTTNFAKEYRTGGYCIELSAGRQPVQKDGLSAFDRKLQLDESRNEYDRRVVNKLPLWDDSLLKQHQDWVVAANDRNKRAALKKGEGYKKLESGDIIEFEALGEFARKRSGTDKIAMLKMDVDGLGTYFRKVDKQEEAKSVSDAMKYFFEEKMLQLWNGVFPYLNEHRQEDKAPYHENIYIVFSGGDDCMMIGAWDAVFHFAGSVQQAFSDYTKELKQKRGISAGFTLSAGLIMVDSKFPMVRMAALADAALDTAKNQTAKNCICVFDRVLSWEEYHTASSIAAKLAKLINVDQESRSILHRVQQSHVGFEKLQQIAINEGRFSTPQIWRLFYYLRNLRGKQDKKELLETYEDIFNDYQKALLQPIVLRKPANAQQFPVAARWAEFLTRGR